MKPISRQQIFAQAARKMRADFEELSVVPHAQLKGNQAEALVRAFLKSHLPKRFGVGSGFIIDARDQVSKQTDVIIYDALNCPIYRASDEAAIIPADNVAAVIEVKAQLDKERLKEAFDNCFAVKSLAKTKEKPDAGALSLAQTFYAVFAFGSPLTAEKISEHYRNMLAEQGGVGRHVDLIVVLDKYLSCLSVKMPGHPGWSPAFIMGVPPQAEGAHIGVGTMILGENSLDGFLRLLLPQLTHFREITGHPGFNWQAMGADTDARLSYWASISLEKDPEKRHELLKKYGAEVTAEFEKANAEHAARPDGQKSETE